MRDSESSTPGSNITPPTHHTFSEPQNLVSAWKQNREYVPMAALIEYHGNDQIDKGVDTNRTDFHAF